MALLLLAASTGVFFLANFLDQLYFQDFLAVKDLSGSASLAVPDLSTRDEGSRRSAGRDENTEFSLKVAALLRELSNEEVDKVVMDDHCDEGRVFFLVTFCHII